MKRIEKQKKGKFKLLSCFDSRDIHRGAVPAKLFYGASKDYYEFNSKVYKNVKNLIELRKSLPSMSKGDFTLLKTSSPANFAYIRSYKDEKILVINNLSGEKLIADITIPAIDVPLLGSFVLFFFVVSIIDKIKPTIANIRASILTIGTQPNTSEIIPNTNPAIPIFYSSI